MFYLNPYTTVCRISSARFYVEAGYEDHQKWQEGRLKANTDLQAALKKRTTSKCVDMETLKRYSREVMATLRLTLEHYHGHNFKAKRRKVRML